MRDYVSKLMQEGHMLIVERQVDPKFELAAVTGTALKQGDRPILFKSVKGTDFPVVTNVYGSRLRLCEFIGADEGAFCRSWTELIKSRQFPEGAHINVVPVLDDLKTGKLSELPLITYFEFDGGRYFTSAIYCAKDPETGIANLSFNRSMYISDQELRVNLGSAHDMTRYQAKAEANGEPLEAAMLIGTAPEIFLAAAAALPYDADELDIASRIAGHPIAMRPCRHIDLMVPVDTEVVVEGRFLPNVRRPEGPFGEFMGHYYPKGDRWVFEVLGAYWRPGAIFHSILCGYPEEIQPLQLAVATKIYQHLSSVLPGIIDVSCLATVANTVVKINQQYEGHARQVALAAFGADLIWSKVCTVVDEDVDIYDLNDVMWAIVLRASADRDIFTVPGVPGFYRDFGKDHWGRLAIDATMPWGRRAEFERKKIPGMDAIRLEDYIAQG